MARYKASLLEHRLTGVDWNAKKMNSFVMLAPNDVLIAWQLQMSRLGNGVATSSGFQHSCSSEEAESVFHAVVGLINSCIPESVGGKSNPDRLSSNHGMTLEIDRWGLFGKKKPHTLNVWVAGDKNLMNQYAGEIGQFIEKLNQSGITDKRPQDFGMLSMPRDDVSELDLARSKGDFDPKTHAITLPANGVNVSVTHEHRTTIMCGALHAVAREQAQAVELHPVSFGDDADYDGTDTSMEFLRIEDRPPNLFDHNQSPPSATPAFNTNGTPMIPGTYTDVTGHPYGS